ncbi:MAG: hypothetical protein ABIY52_10385 [Gemmatimonadaceae bacterium]
MTAVALTATSARARTSWAIPVLAAALVAAGVWWSLAPYLVGVFHDDGVYALLARSIAEGHGFHYSHLPGAPAATHYPPLYPLALALVWHLAPGFPQDIGALLGLNALLAGAAAAGWYVFAVRRLGWSQRAALAGAVVVAMTSPMLTLAGAILSETLFIACLWPVLLVAEPAPGAARARVTLAGAAAGMLMLVRAHALALLIALVAVLLFRRRRSDAVVAMVAAVAVQVPWMTYAHFAGPPVATPLSGSYGSYASWLIAGWREGGIAFVTDTMAMNVRELALLLRDRVTTGIAAVDTLAAIITFAALLVGARSFVRRAPVTLLFFAAYFAIVILWPYTPWRFAWGLWPLVAMLVLEGVRHAWTDARRLRVITGIVAALPLLGLLRTELHSYASRGWRTPARQATARALPMLDWARANTPRDAIILSEIEPVIALYTGRRSAPPVEFSAVEYTSRSESRVALSLAEMLRALPATYLVTATPDVQRAALAMHGTSAKLEQVAAPAGITAFVVKR